MENQYKRYHQGPRWTVLFGRYDGLSEFAVNEAQRMLQFLLPFVVEVRPAAAPAGALKEHVLLLGTAGDNLLIAQLIERGLLAAPTKPQSYTLACLASPFEAVTGQTPKDTACKQAVPPALPRVLVVAGSDDAGLLHGVQDLNARILAPLVDERTDLSRKALDGLGDFAIQESPAIADRGIWTWGFPMFDYRRFLDNMARLRMNMLTLWNDCPPANIGQVLAHARSRGIRVVMGFHWGWGLDGKLDLTKDDDRAAIRQSVVERYKSEYRDLGLDGIYFQTLTEHSDKLQAGRSTAHWAKLLVNETAAELYKLDPGLHIQFGLHATSIREYYTDLAGLDERIVITWEDAGDVPFSYLPADKPLSARQAEIAETRNYATTLMHALGKRQFAMVPKGFGWLQWHVPGEFEHHGPFILGERLPRFIRARLSLRQDRIERFNQWWLREFPAAAEFYRHMLQAGPETRFLVTGLVEDSMFEERIQPSVALFGQTIWNPFRRDDEILQAAMSQYYGYF